MEREKGQGRGKVERKEEKGSVLTTVFILPKA